jgi:tetratricopeptide (TPR) repeat protein
MAKTQPATSWQIDIAPVARAQFCDRFGVLQPTRYNVTMWKALQCVAVLVAVSTAAAASPVTQARTQRLQGKYTQALKTLRAGEKQGSTQWAWHVAMAETLEKVGQYDDALGHTKQARTLAPLQPQPILVQGRLLETLNRRDQAKATYDAVKELIDKNAHQKTAAALVATGQILDRHAALSQKRASDQARNILHNYLQRAYQELDETYWPAHVAAAEFLLAKHKPGPALTEYTLLAKKNSKVAAMYTGQAAVALSR